MKWQIIRKGNKYKRRLKFDVEDWICLTVIVGVAFILFLRAIIRSM